MPSLFPNKPNIDSKAQTPTFFIPPTAQMTNHQHINHGQKDNDELSTEKNSFSFSFSNSSMDDNKMKKDLYTFHQSQSKSDNYDLQDGIKNDESEKIGHFQSNYDYIFNNDNNKASNGSENFQSNFENEVQRENGIYESLSYNNGSHDYAYDINYNESGIECDKSGIMQFERENTMQISPHYNYHS